MDHPQPITTHERLNTARFLLSEGHAQVAADVLSKVITTFQADTDAIRLLAHAYFVSGNQDDARKWHQEANNNEPNHPLTLFELACIARDDGRYDDAITLLERLIELRPEFGPGWYDLGAALLNKGETARAIPILWEAVRCRPDDAGSHCLLGQVLEHDQQWTEAEQAYRHALRLDPSNLEHHLLLARIQTQQHDFSAALQVLDAAFGLFPEDSELRLERGLTRLRARQWDEAEADFSAILAAWVADKAAPSEPITSITPSNETIAAGVYLHIAYLMTGRIDRAWNTLVTIQDSDWDTLASHLHVIPAWFADKPADYSARIFAFLSNYLAPLAGSYRDSATRDKETLLRALRLHLIQFYEALALDSFADSAWHFRAAIQEAMAASGLQLQPLTSIEQGAQRRLSARLRHADSDLERLRCYFIAEALLPHHRLAEFAQLLPLPATFYGPYSTYAFRECLVMQETGEADQYVSVFTQTLANLETIFQTLENFSATIFLDKVSPNINGSSLSFSASNVREAMMARGQFLTRYCAMKGIPEFRQPPVSRRRLRVGVLLRNLEAMTESFLALGHLKGLNRQRFERIAYVNEGGLPDHDFAQTLLNEFDSVVDLSPWHWEEKVFRIREQDLDVFLSFRINNIASEDVAFITSCRLARRQINLAAMQGITTGLPSFDYTISAELLEPVDGEAHYSEKLVCLPGHASIFAFGPAPFGLTTEQKARLARADTVYRRAYPDVSAAVSEGQFVSGAEHYVKHGAHEGRRWEGPTRQDFGLPPHGPVLASGAAMSKLLPELIDLYLSVLEALPNSTLVLYPFNPFWWRDGAAPPAASYSLRQRIIRQCEAREIKPERIVILPPQ